MINTSKLLEFFKKSKRLATIDRCSNTPHIQKYSVAEHSYYTALFAMVFADIENLSLDDTHKYDTSEVIKKALIHDFEESVTGDILYPFKHLNDKLGPKLKKAIKDCVDLEVFIDLPDEIHEYYKRLWNCSKDITKEGRLIAAMDKFEILIYAISEMNMGNVESFRTIYGTAIMVLEKEHNDIKSLMDVVNKIKSIYG